MAVLLTCALFSIGSIAVLGLLGLSAGMVHAHCLFLLAGIFEASAWCKGAIKNRAAPEVQRQPVTRYSVTPSLIVARSKLQ